MDITQAINHIIKRIDDLEKNIYIKIAEIIENGTSSEDLKEQLSPKRGKKSKKVEPTEVETTQEN